MLPSPTPSHSTPAPAFAPARPRDSAAVLLVRQGESGDELFWVRRGAALNFFSGFYAFPGGALDPDDARVAVVGAQGDHATQAAAAARELFEETGVLLARFSEGTPAQPDLARWRRELLAERVRFHEVLAALRAEIHARDLVPAGRWITPDFSPTRYDARFFLANLPEGQAAEVWDGELAEGQWIRPIHALARWAAGSALLHPPILHAMRVIAAHGVEEALPLLRNPPLCDESIPRRIEFQRGVVLLPLRTPTLPPARHTASYLLGTKDLLLVDPGSPYPEEQRKLERLVDEMAAEGRRLTAIVVTHAHPDHLGGLAAARQAFGVPVLAHERTAAQIPGVDRTLEDGETLALAGDPPMRFQVVHTPGHTPGHLCLFEPASRALVCGDMVSGASTIVIDPPEGDMAQYLASLDRLAALEPGTLYPAHGAAMAAGRAKLAEYKQHRLWREERILEALRAGPLSLGDVVSRAYSDTPQAMYPLAERSALAALIKLERERRVARRGERFERTGDRVDGS